MGDKVEKLLRTIDELQASESSSQLIARRAERELREEKETALYLEKELEGWKNLKGTTSSLLSRTGTTSTWRSSLSGMSTLGEETTRAGGKKGLEVPARKTSLSKVPARQPSFGKGFI